MSILCPICRHINNFTAASNKKGVCKNKLTFVCICRAFNNLQKKFVGVDLNDQKVVTSQIVYNR